MKIVKSMLAVTLSLGLLLLGSVPAVAQERLMCTLQERSSGSSDLYAYQFSNGGSIVTANVRNGGSIGGAVTVAVPSDCTVESAGEKLTGVAGSTGVAKVYSFSDQGDYNLTITAPAVDDTAYYAVYTFSIWSAGNTAGKLPDSIVQTPEMNSNLMRSVVFAGSSSFTTKITDKAVVDYKSDVKFGSSVTASIAKDNAAPTEYKSGTPITEPGSYNMVFTSTTYPDITKPLSFTVVEIKEEDRPEDYRYIPPVAPENEFHPNIEVDKDREIIGGWTGSISPPPIAENIVNKDKDIPVENTPDKEIPKDNADISDSIQNGGPGGPGGNINSSTGTGNNSGTGNSTGSSGDSYDFSTTSGGGQNTGVVEATLYESYNQLYDTYEMRFQNKYFYTNAGNGSIVSRPVVLDIPKGISLQMAKDGEVIAVSQKSTFSEYGSYNLLLSYQETDGTRYLASYRFRIQKLPTDTSADGSTAAPAASGNSGTSSVTVLPPTVPGLDSKDQAMLDAIQGADGKPHLSDQATDEEIQAYVDSLTEGEMGAPYVKLEGLGGFLGMNQSYDSARNMYRQETLAKTVFHTSVPNGALVNDAVTMSLDAKIKTIVTKDGQPYEYISGEGFNQPGAYCVVIEEDNIAYSMANSVKPRFTFRIVGPTVSSMDIYYPPSGYHVETVTCDDVDMDEKGAYLTFDKDGVYRITVAAPEETSMPPLQLDFELDTQAPVFTLDGVENGVASSSRVAVVYESSDVEHAELYNADSFVEGFNGSEINTPGDYKLLVYDKAGNVSTTAFVMKYKMNIAAIMAILIIVAIVGIVVYFVKLTRTKVRVR